MSLVHEALLKAEREKQRKTGGASVTAQWAQPVTPRPAPLREEKPVITPTKTPWPAQTPVSHALAQEPSRSRWTTEKSHQTMLALVAACVALVAIVGIVFIVSRSAQTAHKSELSAGSTPAPAVSPSAQAEPNSPPAETLTQSAVIPSPLDVSRYKITGIMKDPQGNYCAVINGRVAYAEQYIDGAVVKIIERDRVTLNESGREFVVRLN